MAKKANNDVTAKVTIKGFRPLLWHWFGPHALPLEAVEKTGVAGHDPEEWRKTYLATKEGQLYVDASYVFACIRDGGSKVKLGRGNAKAAVSSTLEVEETRVLIDRFMPEGYKTMDTADFPIDADEPVYLDVRSVRNPSTKARNIRYRVAASPDWTATFHITWDKTIVPRDVMHSILIDAGKLCGLGDGRSIGCGRFTVEKFEEIKDAKKKTA